MHRLVCGNCGRIEVFISQDQAYQEGWDTPATYGYTACDLCPGVSVYFPLMYCAQAKEARSNGDLELAAELLDKAAEQTMLYCPNTGEAKKQYDVMVKAFNDRKTT